VSCDQTSGRESTRATDDARDAAEREQTMRVARSARSDRRLLLYADCHEQKSSEHSKHKEQFMTQVGEVMTRGLRSLVQSDNMQLARRV